MSAASSDPGAAWRCHSRARASIGTMSVKLFMEVLSQVLLQRSFEAAVPNRGPRREWCPHLDKHESAIVVFCEGSPPSLCGLGTSN